MKMTFKEIAETIQKRYEVDMATANQTAKSLFEGDRNIKKNGFRNSEELNNYLDDLEEQGT